MYVVFCLLAIILILLWIKAKPFYWKKKNVPFLIPLPFFGNLFPVLQHGLYEYFQQLNKKFPGHKYFGMHFLTRPTLFIKSPEIIQNILIKDFEHFTSHGFYANQDRDPGGGNLFLLHGQQWKEMRGKLNFYFTPTKVKAMLTSVDTTFPKLTAVLDKNIAEGKPSDLNDLLLNASIDIITQAIFGTESDAFIDENSLFCEIVQRMFQPKFTMRMFTSIMSSKLYDFFDLTMFDKDFNGLITNVLKKTIAYRRKNNIKKHDFVQGMMELLDTEKSDEERKHFPDNTRVPYYNMDTVISQAILLHVGGAETPALTMAFLLYEMSLNPDIQDRCRAEVNSVVDDDEPLAIKNLSDLPYLTASIKETLRMHSSFRMINRQCTKTYTFPDSDLTIEPGTFILMSPLAAHMDEENFPEPKKFRPERFLEGERNTIKTGSFFPFGLGPRICLGASLAFGEMKLVLGRLLQRYEFSICSQTQVPVQHAKYLFLTTPAKGMWLEVKPISGN